MKNLVSALVSFSLVALVSCERSSEGALKIVKEELIEAGPIYEVSGSIHNPTDTAAVNVVIGYEIWGRLKKPTREIRGTIDDGGLVTSKINYLPPGATVSFKATGQNVSVMKNTRGILPDPLKARITNGWEK
jgi:hypothetical protein